MTNIRSTETNQQQTQRSTPLPDEEPGYDYEDAVHPNKLCETVTTTTEDLWAQNEQAFDWAVTESGRNVLMVTVPGGGKSTQIEVVVPKLAAETGRTFVLVTTELRNRQDLYRAVCSTIQEVDFTEGLTVEYIPSPRESYKEMPGKPGGEGESCEDESQGLEHTVCQSLTTDENDEPLYDETVVEDMKRLLKHGAGTSAIHNAALNEWLRIRGFEGGNESDYPLECQQQGAEQGYDPMDSESEPACRYRRILQRRMERIENEGADLIVCGASQLNLLEEIGDWTAILDEDVTGELKTTYPESFLRDAVNQYLAGIDVGPNSYRGSYRVDDEVQAEVAKTIRENHAPRRELDDDDDRVPMVYSHAPVKSSIHYDSALAPLLTLVWVDGERTAETNHWVFDPDDMPYTVAIDLNADNANNSHDMVGVVSPPQPLQVADQVIGMDATGSEEWWELLAGVPFESVSPNPQAERSRVVTESFDVEFRELTDDMVSINRPDNLSARKFYAILQALVDHHDADEVSIVTSKAMKEKVEESEYADRVMELAYGDEILHYNNLRSSREFGKSPLHVVIGAPHPGDDAVRQRMALLGHDDKIVQNYNNVVSGEDRFKGAARDVLQDMVYSSVYQGSRRGGRDPEIADTSYSYLYTGMYDDKDIDADESYSVEIFGQGEKCKVGMEEILNVLDQADEALKTKEVVSAVNDELAEDSLSYNRVLEKLNELNDRDMIMKSDWIRSKKWALETSPQHGKLVKRTNGDGG